MEGNKMKMREALNNIGNAAAWVAENCNDQQTATYMNDIIAMTQAALSAPPRQCDVGTPDEQGVRCLATMRHWRKAYQGDALITAIMKWAREPYAEEGAGK